MANETMFICKGGAIVIGDTITGNIANGERFFFYTEKEAIKRYREKHGLVGKHFNKKYVSPIHFGFLKY